MNRSALFRCLSIACVALLAISGCRGKFEKEACAGDARVDVPANARIGFYYNSQGQLVGEPEDMNGTADNKMCPSTPPDPNTPGTCRKAGYCVVNINGTDYCVKCP